MPKPLKEKHHAHLDLTIPSWLVCSFSFIVAFGGILMNWAIVSKRPDLAWLVSLVTIGASIAYCGSYCVGTWKGIFIDRRNVMSPSRLQMTCWTVVVTSALLSIAVWRIWFGSSPALDVNVPQSYGYSWYRHHFSGRRLAEC